MRYFKSLDSKNRIIRLDNSYIEACKNATEISSVEYKLLKAAVKIYVNLESIEAIKAEGWWL